MAVMNSEWPLLRRRSDAGWRTTVRSFLPLHGVVMGAMASVGSFSKKMMLSRGHYRHHNPSQFRVRAVFMCCQSGVHGPAAQAITIIHGILHRWLTRCRQFLRGAPGPNMERGMSRARPGDLCQIDRRRLSIGRCTCGGAELMNAITRQTGQRLCQQSLALPAAALAVLEVLRRKIFWHVVAPWA
jgi:transposase-like protein